MLVISYNDAPPCVPTTTCDTTSSFNFVRGEDTTVFEEFPEQTGGDLRSNTLDTSTGGPNAEVQALIKFDLTALPVGTVVNQATLRIFVTDDTVGKVRGYRMISAWNAASTTWLSLGSDGISNDGVEAEMSYSFDLRLPDKDEFDFVDVTDDVAFFVTNPTMNQGWGLLGTLAGTFFRRLCWTILSCLRQPNFPSSLFVFVLQMESTLLLSMLVFRV